MESLPDRPLPSRPIAQTVRAWLQWFGLLRLSVIAAAVLAVGAGGYWLLRTPAAPVEQQLPMAARGSTGPGSPMTTATMAAVTGAVTDAAATTSVAAGGTSARTSETTEPTEIIVHVAGAVARPGVVRLPVGARAEDAVAAAGGTAADADLDAVNLAASLRDGDRLYVPHIGQPVPSVVAASGGVSTGKSSSGSAAPTGPVDLNRATADQLDALPGVGPATAAAIVAYRDQHGPFASVDDLLDVRGIGPAKLDAIRALVTV